MIFIIMFKQLLIILTTIHTVLCYNIPIVSRRMILQNTAKCMTGIALVPTIVRGEDVNRPLTEEEMEEYKKLLIEAERIKSVIDANKKAFLKEFDDQSQFKNITSSKK